MDEEEAARIARLPFSCMHPGCQKRFATNSKRNAHVRCHSDAKRYMCALDHGGEDTSLLYFSTWTELQAHQRESHPPSCDWPGCGKTFANSHNLRLHLQRHREREREHGTDVLGEGVVVVRESEDDGAEDEKRPPTFPCNWTPEGQGTAGCVKTFRSKYAREVHIKNQHLGLREYACHHPSCTKRYGNKRSLNRHMSKCTLGAKGKEITADIEESAASTDGESENCDEDGAVSDEGTPLDDDFFRREGGAVPESAAGRERARKRAREEGSSGPGALFSSLTGRGYGEPGATKKRRMRGRIVACPWSKICLLRDDGQSDSAQPCPFRFSRLYDVQRHLQAAHSISLLQAEIASLLDKEEGSRLATPRSTSREHSLMPSAGGHSPCTM